MARTVGLKVKKTKGKAQTPPQNPPTQATGNGNSNPEDKKE